MDSRQRRVNRIAQALIEQGLINSDSDDTDDDFSSEATEQSSKSDSSMTNSEEEPVVDQKELERQQKQKKKQEKQEFDSLKDALRSRIRSDYKVKDQYKLTDEEFTRHLAATAIWNQMTRERAARDLLTENLQFERSQELQRQERFIDTRPYTAYITSDSPLRTFKAILELHYGPAAQSLFYHLKKGTPPDEWNATLDSKQLPDDCNYEKLLQAFQRSERGYQTNKKIVKASYHDGRLSRFESLELQDQSQLQQPTLAQLQEAEAQLQNKCLRTTQYNTKLKTVNIPPTTAQSMMLVNGKATPIVNLRPRKRQPQNTISFDAAVRHQQELYNKTKMMAQEIQNQALNAASQAYQTKSNIQTFQPINQLSEQKPQVLPKQQNAELPTIQTIAVPKPFGMYNVMKKPGPFVDQSAYVTNPSAKEVQTTVSLIEDEETGPTNQYKIVASVPKRNQFNKFYNVVDGRPCSRTMNVLMQTDLIAKQVRGKTIVEKGAAGEGSNAYLIFDGAQHELQKTTKAQQTKLLKACNDLQINRWKGRQGTLLNDFLELVKKLRPDLYARGDSLFINNRSIAAKAAAGTEKASKRDPEREGVWPTLDGVFLEQQKKGDQPKVKQEGEESSKEDTNVAVDRKVVPGHFVEVVHTHVDDFYTGAEAIQYQGDNGHQCPSFLDKFYKTFDTIEEQREYARNLIKKQNFDQFKYTHPVTGDGYNTIEEYQKIQEKLKQNEQQKIQPIIDKMHELQQQFQDLINQEEFAAAQEVYIQMNKLIVPTYIQYRDEDLPESRLSKIKLPLNNSKNHNTDAPTDVDYLTNENILDRDFKINKVVGFATTIQNVGRQIAYTHPFKQLE